MSYGGFEYNSDHFGGFDPMGGGFMNEDNKSTDKKPRDRQSLLPVTIKQLLSSRSHDDDVFRVDEVELNTIKLIGTIAGAPQVHSTNITFMLNDGSGSIECTQWVETDSGGYSKIQNLREGVLVRVVGTLRDYDNKFNVMVFDANPVTDWNELSYHILEVVFTHLQNTKGPIPGTAPVALPGQSSTMVFNPHGNMQHAQPASFGGGGGGGGGGMSLNNAIKKENKGLNEVIFRAYQSSRDEKGMSYEDVMYVLKSQGHNIGMDNLMGGVMQLCEDGRLYITIDDNHYRPTTDE